jgi:hypothetical protein
MLSPTDIDLKPFCSRKRDFLFAPFSVGDHTYATDAIICVRIQRRPDVPEADVALRVSAPRVFRDSVCDYRQLAPLKLPRGLKGVFVQIGDATFQAKYVRRMLALPGLQVSNTLDRRALRFCFDGGDGLLMAFRGPVEFAVTAHFVCAPREAITP